MRKTARDNDNKENISWEKTARDIDNKESIFWEKQPGTMTIKRIYFWENIAKDNDNKENIFWGKKQPGTKKNLNLAALPEPSHLSTGIIGRLQWWNNLHLKSKDLSSLIYLDGEIHCICNNHLDLELDK